MKQTFEKAIEVLKNETNKDLDEGTQCMIEAIKKLAHFKGLIKDRSLASQVHMQRLAVAMRVSEYKKGQIIYNKGDQG